tara:strand:+ start:2054 stop:2338 length:285 start_codon:yes stop_codon:yes gene_type:complete
MATVTYISGYNFKKLNAKAIRHNLNRSIERKMANELSDDVLMPVTFAMPHNDVDMRCQFACANPFDISDPPAMMELWLDMSLKDYSKYISTTDI